MLRSSRGAGGRVQLYRRAVGWVIVALSYGMALIAWLEASGVEIGLDDVSFTSIGVTVALLVIAMLARARSIRKALG